MKVTDDDIGIDAALTVILDRAVEKGGAISMELRVRIIACLALFPVAVRHRDKEHGGHGFRCAQTHHVLGTVGYAPVGYAPEGGRRYAGKLHTYATKSSRVVYLDGRHRDHGAALDELEQALVRLGWSILDLARWRREIDDRRAEYARLTLPGMPRSPGG